ncbi:MULTISPECIES: Dabb family protein [Paenibacillus]|uniref:Dabb family protein n=2 Tax=Paenibacillus TaxID=44249 RepID=A0ABU6DLD3_9BACL|nr:MULTISPECIES: Dabb family protein [Paenibacillus]MBA2941548.1 Dabb family protein [Paenibacillus sp. CGMCC 1.16610]MCY9662099.1 Dabb family protein [Paenibacillus anseongense]MEB4798316.1 Dabb family protein [Paenibacillus chondroitinus]MVQ40363.1 Dabb family protein [Paenibacillus anseongense]
MNSKRIKHMVVFNLQVGKDTPEAEQFLRGSAQELAAIPGVEQFEVFRQVSAKTDYDFGFSMVFADQAAYDAYNVHPVHTKYVAERWVNEVSRFQEIDLTVYE